MGNEGGTIARRQDILSLHNSNQASSSKSAAKGGGGGGEISEDAEQVLLQTCAISGLPLYQNNPIVGDYRGKLYIKEKILQYMLDFKLDKSKLKLPFQHLKSLKDLCAVAITWAVIDDIAHFQCPITKELDDKTSYCYLRPCGCVLSYKYLKELKKTIVRETLDRQGQHDARCPVCNKEFTFDYDLVIINPMDNPDFLEINNENYKHLKHVLRLSNAKEPLKKKKSKPPELASEGSLCSTLELPKDEFVRKRKQQDLDEVPNETKRTRA
ncbi:uncharacterized protein LODBEIA_P27030 [Lodderomyces beijingensis]|uniref:Replication termination factor 2 n=1 Tax=Lodderomyces beijingensis TaxID=1775926 RepID=A0ABP0ZKR9_9ASCO